MSFDQANTQAINADTNTTNEETTVTTTVTETVTTAVETKAAKPITTAKYARHLLALQEARVKRLEDELLDARSRVEELDYLAATLPESAPTTAANVKQYAVGEGFDQELFTVFPGQIIASAKEDEAPTEASI